MKIKQPFKTALFSILLACGVVSTQPALAAGQTVRVGIMSGEDEDVWRAVAANAARQGLTVKVTTFSDYTQPNEALSEHDLDANSFQHKPYLDAQIKARGYDDRAGGFYLCAADRPVFAQGESGRRRCRMARRSACRTIRVTKAAHCCCCRPASDHAARWRRPAADRPRHRGQSEAHPDQGTRRGNRGPRDRRSRCRRDQHGLGDQGGHQDSAGTDRAGTGDRTIRIATSSP